MEQFVYADNAATTKLSPAVLEAMMPYLTEEYGKPLQPVPLWQPRQTRHRAGPQGGSRMCWGAEPFEILFTGGGTEADNWVKEIMRSLKAKGKNHFITSAVEHHACCTRHSGCRRKALRSPSSGGPRRSDRPEQVRAAIRPETGLVSIMFANNEIGTIYPIQEIGAILPPGRGAVPHRRGAGRGPSAHQRQGDEHRPALRCRPINSTVPRASAPSTAGAESRCPA